MAEDITIGVLTETEIPRAIALWQACTLPGLGTIPMPTPCSRWSGPSSTILAARRHGELVGTAMVGHDGHRGAVYYVGVRPDAQKSGVGARLMAAAEQWLKDRGVPKLKVMVRTDNLGARGF